MEINEKKENKRKEKKTKYNKYKNNRKKRCVVFFVREIEICTLIGSTYLKFHSFTSFLFLLPYSHHPLILNLVFLCPTGCIFIFPFFFWKYCLEKTLSSPPLFIK